MSVGKQKSPLNKRLPSIGGRRLYAIGDIHGRFDLLEKLLAKIDHHAGDNRYQLVFLGDYIDRGPDSWGVIERLIMLRKQKPDTIFLKGNHEQVMIDFLAEPDSAEAWLDWGGIQTLQSYGIEQIRGATLDELQAKLIDLLPDAHFRFLLNLQLFYQCDDYLFVHAGVKPDRPLEQQLERDLLWIRDEFLNDRGQLWQGRTIVHGHTPIAQAMDAGWRINVDTGAYASGQLTATCLTDDAREFVST